MNKTKTTRAPKLSTKGKRAAKTVKQEKCGRIKNKTQEVQTLRGMRDILPSEQKYWRFVQGKINEIAAYYSFQRIDTPIMENTGIFKRGVGAFTDIVEKEMYSFVDQGGDKITLRPECTVPIARAYIQHGMINQPQPVKLFYIGPMFRHERPQAGRLRQFWQAGFEVLGEGSPVVDAQLIQVCSNIFADLGIPVNIQVNSVGCHICREEYKRVLVDYYKSRRNALCEHCKKRIVKNPMRLLDCKEKDCTIIKKDAPQIVDFLCDHCKNHFMKVVEYLDDLEVPYVLNPFLARGLDYYTNTVFEVFEEGDDSTQGALGGGGRYDKLLEELDGRETPAAGFSFGLDRIITALKNNKIEMPLEVKPDVFAAQLGEIAKKKAMILFEQLRKEGIAAVENFSRDALKSQMEAANKLKVRFVLILGQKEVMEKVILLRDMENGVQEVIDYKKIIPELKKRLS